MNKKLLIALLVIAFGLAIYNITLVDFTAPFEGDSLVACIGVLASLCAVTLLLIYHTSKRIQKNLSK